MGNKRKGNEKHFKMAMKNMFQGNEVNFFLLLLNNKKKRLIGVVVKGR